jgi:hypothetical protein
MYITIMAMILKYASECRAPLGLQNRREWVQFLPLVPLGSGVMVARLALNQEIVGSTPTSPAKYGR